MTSTGMGQKKETGSGRGVLVGPGWLTEHLADPGVRVVEVDVSPAAYDSGHIDGAVLWNIYEDIKDADYHTVDTSMILRLLERSGIDRDSTVVFYGYAPAMGFWLMKLFGHKDVRILDGGRQSIAESGLPWTSIVPDRLTTRYQPGVEHGALRADHRQVRDAMSESAQLIVDVRSDPEFRGERFWPSGGLEPGGRAGHVPTAVRVPVDGVLDEHGSFRTDADLREIFMAADAPEPKEIITYCTIGGRACTAWFVLTYLLGRPNVRVYDGSWAEWGRMPDSPVETALAQR